MNKWLLLLLTIVVSTSQHEAGIKEILKKVSVTIENIEGIGKNRQKDFCKKTRIDAASHQNKPKNNDCNFDQSSQTDKFLKGIPALSNYHWDTNSKTATILLNNKDTLTITRGGCDHFVMQAKFILHTDITDYSNWENVFDKVLWIAELLNDEFAFLKDIKSALNNEKYHIKSREPGEHLYFDDPDLQQIHYQIKRRLLKDKKVLVFGYYLN